MKKVISLILVTMLFTTGCAKEENSTYEFLNQTARQETAQEQVKQTETKQTTESREETVDTEITREFLEERYPGKTILDYLYVEPVILNEGEKLVQYTDEEKGNIRRDGSNIKIRQFV